MDKQYKKYLYMLITTQILICIVVASVLIFLSKDISSHNNTILQISAVKNTEDCMREMVDNTIIRIDLKRKKAVEEAKNIIDFTSNSLSLTDESKIYEQLESSMKKLYGMEYGQPIKCIIHNSQNQKTTFFENNRVMNITDQSNIQKIKDYIESCILHKTIVVNDVKLCLFAEQSDIDAIAKKSIYDEIHSSIYDENEYIWVNEIIDFSGGDNYAIRRIHPNLKDSEGTYLSTNKEDIKGNLPYLNELNGINQKGEVVHIYYFKNKTNDDITEKISYAKLYKPFNWVIATGKPLNDIFGYTNELINYDSRVVNKTMVVCLIFMIIIFFIGIVIIIKVHKRYRKKIDKYVRTETELDPLTGAFSRKVAETILLDAFKSSNHNSFSSLIMIFDIDDFKKINDSFGHDVGDIVLKKVSQVVLSNIKEGDYLFRWGGEEFILLCNDINGEYHFQVGQKILKCISDVSFESNKEFFNVSVSIGSSYFHDEDTDYLQALKRADIALYHSKNTGKNKYTNSEELFKEDC